MQTALHIATVVAEARRLILGAVFYDSAFYRKERAAFLFFKKDKKKFALALRFHPVAHGCYIVPAGKVTLQSGSSGEKPFPFFQEAYGMTLEGLEQLSFDRLIRLRLAEESKRRAIVLEALGPSGNVWLLDENDGRSAVLRNRDFTAGELYELPGAGTRLAPTELTAEALIENFAEYTDRSVADALSKTVSGIDLILAREALTRANCDGLLNASELTTDQASALIESIESLVELAQSGQSGYLYAAGLTPSAQPFKLKSVASEPEKFASYSIAQQALALSRKDSGEAADESKQIRQALKSALKKQERTLKNIERDLADAQNYERYKHYADILKAHLGEVSRGLKEITLPNLYGAGDVTIALDEKLDGPANADAYYKKFKKGREGLETLARRKEIAAAELARLRELSSAFEADPDSATLRFAEEIAALQKSKAGAQAPGVSAPRLPYRTYYTSSGLSIFVGRDGTDNDDTTFKHIKPYELWFHAGQCPGSHVGLKYPNKDFKPSKSEIEETAAIAAWFSKARNNKSAPVNYTERRYVRKPRKAKAGLVTIERERTVMVTPTEPRKPAED